ncbi:MAG TPA: alcohol dehydrogenase catalytic domain-containing protein [Planctomycetota bacterium]
MKALVWTGPHQAEIRTSPDPTPKPDEVVVRIRASGVCGSDLLGFVGKSKKRVPPLVLGHEMAGDVAAVGSGVRDLAPGTRVAILPLFTCGLCAPCRRGRSNLCPSRLLLGMNLPGGFAEYAVAPRPYVYPVGGLEPLAASMIEPLATPLNFFDSHARGPVETVAVLGAGTQGLLALQLARLAGAREVVAVDTNDARLAVARRLGATRAINPASADAVAAVLDATKGEGCDAVVDAAGVSATRQQAVRMCARGGTVGLVGLHDPESPLDCMDVIGREVAVHGVYGYTAAHFRKALDLVTAGKVDVTSWVREYPLEEGAAVLARLVTKPGDLVKASLTP